MSADTLGCEKKSQRQQESQERQRLSAIATIISQRKVKSQTDLRQLLASIGIHTTQSSISRSLAKLGVIKLGGCYSLPGARS